MNSETTETITKDVADAALTAIDYPEDHSGLEIASYLDKQIQEKLENMNLTTAQTMQVLTIIHDTVRPEITKLTAMWNGANLQQQNLMSDMSDWKMEISLQLAAMSDTEATHHAEVANDISAHSYLLGQHSLKISQADYRIDEIRNGYLPNIIELLENNTEAIQAIQDTQKVLKHYHDTQMYLLSYQQSKLSWKLWYHISGRCIMGGDGWLFPPLREYAVCNDVPAVLCIRWWLSDLFQSIRTNLSRIFGKKSENEEEEPTDDHTEQSRAPEIHEEGEHTDDHTE